MVMAGRIYMPHEIKLSHGGYYTSIHMVAVFEVISGEFFGVEYSTAIYIFTDYRLRTIFPDYRLHTIFTDYRLQTTDYIYRLQTTDHILV